MTSDSDSAPCVEPKLSLTKVRQTLSNLMLLLHQTKTAVVIDSDSSALLLYLIHQLGLAHERSSV